MNYALILLIVLACIVFYILWRVVSSYKWWKKYDAMEIQMKNLIKTYNTDTANLHKKNDELHARNAELAARIKDAETDVIAIRTRMKSVQSDNERLKKCDHQCKWHCKKEQKLNNKPVVVNEQPKKKIGRPRKNW